MNTYRQTERGEAISAEALHATLAFMRERYARLHDLLSDAIEGEEFTETAMPESYPAMVEALAACVPAIYMVNQLLGELPDTDLDQLRADGKAYRAYFRAVQDAGGGLDPLPFDDWIANGRPAAPADDDDDEDVCVACGVKITDSEGWDGFCGDCADIACDSGDTDDPDHAVREWAKANGHDFDHASDDGAHGLRVEYVQSKLVECAACTTKKPDTVYIPEQGESFCAACRYAS